ncbi:hypothetical protein [Hyphomicrobium sp.]|uniref:hypothetical protein n=1 Tax=Hyphomicrobium sp. TaxID=82 RepID=UPI002E3528F6|nr:hypothetical protein [Hyphomicrobium sp.]HEX2842751.1 hypothetical protein [Hyphomicrobium sp.]
MAVRHSDPHSLRRRIEAAVIGGGLQGPLSDAPASMRLACRLRRELQVQKRLPSVIHAQLVHLEQAEVRSI